MSRLRLSVFLILVALAGAARADEAPAARAYLDDLQQSIAQVRNDLPRLTADAQRAADAYVNNRFTGIRGDESLIRELSWRNGGFMELSGAGDTVIDLPRTDGPAELRAIAAWTWTAEWFAACTRLGRTPVMHKHRDLDYRRQWHRRYRGRRFHDDVRVEPIAPGVLGRQYLDAIDLMLRDIGTASWPAIARTSRRAASTIVDGGRVYLRAGGPYLPFHVEDDLFTPLNHDGEDPAQLAPGGGHDDFVIAIGQNEEPGSDDWGEPALLRRASRGVAWCVGAYQRRPGRLRRGEIVIDQQWPVGESLVKIPGYPIRIAPGGSVAAVAIYHMLLAQVRAEVEDHRAHSKRPLPQPAPAPVPKKPAPPPPPPAVDPNWILATLDHHDRAANLQRPGAPLADHQPAG